MADPTPSTSGPSAFETASVAGEFASKFFGIADGLYSLKLLWTGKTKEKNLLKRIGMSAFYTAKVGAGGIAVAVAFGATFLAAPIAGLIVGGVNFATSIAEGVREQDRINGFQKQLKEAEKELATLKGDLNRHRALHQDLEESQAEIRDLREQRVEIQATLDRINGKIKREELDTEKTTRVVDLQEKAFKNNVIKEFIEKNDLSDPKSLSIPQVAHALVKLKEENNKLLEGFKPEQRPYTKEQAVTAEKIKRNEILISHFSKIRDLQAQVKELSQEKSRLDQKYLNPPYSKLDPQKREALKELEEKYFKERIDELNQKISDKISLTERSEKAESYAKEAEGLDKVEDSELVSALTASLNSEKDDLGKQIDKQNEMLKGKEQYAKLFLDPTKDSTQDIHAVWEASKKVVDLQNNIKLSKIDRNKKVRGAVLSGVAVGCSIGAIFFPPLAAVVVGIGIAAGASALWGKYQRHKAEKQLAKDAIRVTEDLAKKGMVDGAKDSPKEREKVSKSAKEEVSQTDKLGALLSSKVLPSGPTVQPSSVSASVAPALPSAAQPKAFVASAAASSSTTAFKEHRARSQSLRELSQGDAPAEAAAEPAQRKSSTRFGGGGK